MNNIIEGAKYKIYNSEIMLYNTPEKIEEAFKKIYVFNNKRDFLKAYGRNDYSKGDKLEGFNRNDGSYLGPDATVHTVIHEVLHAMSSKFDKQGHRIKNGIEGENSFRFANQVNEGITDYLASKLSGEPPRHYKKGHKLFSKLEPMIQKYTKDPNILAKIYLTNDVGFLQDFLNHYGKDNTFEDLYDNFLFMNDNKLNDMLQIVDKNLNKDLRKRERKEKINNFFDKVKNIFTKKEKVKLLTDGNPEIYLKEGKEKQFKDKYNINNFKSTTIKAQQNDRQPKQNLQKSPEKYEKNER